MLSQFEIINFPAALIVLAFFALAVGSFLNVVIYRLPLMLKAEQENECHHEAKQESITKINLFLPRSFCPVCKTPVPVWFNIPLLSYCLLRGRCRHCKQRISIRYPIVELLSCLFSLLAAWYFGFTITLLFVLFYIWILIALFFIDLEHQLLPDSLTLSLLWLGLIANTQSLFTTLPDAVLSAALAYLALWLFIKLFYLLTHKIGMGNGDFKLFAAFGAWFGWVQLPFILLFASLTGAIIGFTYLKYQGKTKETPIPFGPFLCLAGIISIFWGNVIMHWYLSFWF
ncbi:prepilin peptidase [Tatlockia micdadei]|uniref:prepilin peptidase n=1 Tax=Legionella micdadei TaxID=451 RepID=UPI0015706DBE|nr:A24 family peptidase [Legionella micdadei]NSL17676.1 prepilin peptidase [Legionella micdadei]